MGYKEIFKDGVNSESIKLAGEFAREQIKNNLQFKYDVQAASKYYSVEEYVQEMYPNAFSDSYDYTVKIGQVKEALEKFKSRFKASSSNFGRVIFFGTCGEVPADIDEKNFENLWYDQAMEDHKKDFTLLGHKAFLEAERELMFGKHKQKIESKYFTIKDKP